MTAGTTARKNAYFPTSHALFEDPRYAAVVGEPICGWSLMRMTHDADRAWPAHPALPRWVKQPILDYLVSVGLVEFLPNDLYAIPSLDAQRAKTAEDKSEAGKKSAEDAIRDESGHFAPRSHPTPVGPTPSNTCWTNAIQQTSNYGDVNGDGDVNGEERFSYSSPVRLRARGRRNRSRVRPPQDVDAAAARSVVRLRP